MRTRVIICIIFVIMLLCAIQVILDYNAEMKLERESAAVTKAKEYQILIEIEDKTLYLLENGKRIKKYPIASGKKGWPSPLGAWKIVNKGDWGEGFGGHWMGLNVPWGKYGIHGTTAENSIGRSASHGCIRMFNRHVAELYRIVPVGTPVTIVNGSFGPFGKGFVPLNPGDRGADVRAIQLRLKDLGYFKGWPSGIYEDDLKAAVHKFQKDHKLSVQNTITKMDWLNMGFREFE